MPTFDAIANSNRQWANYGEHPTGISSGSGITGGGVPYADLAKQLNDFMAGQAKNQFLLNMPNYQALTNKFSDITGEQLAGKVPQDVANMIAQGAAERGIATGSPGSPNSNSALLRALGLTSMEQQKTGAANLHQGIADTPISPTWNPASLFVPEYLGNLELRAAGGGGGGYGRPGTTINPGPAPVSRGVTPGPNYMQPAAVYGPGGGATAFDTGSSSWWNAPDTTGGGYGLGDDWSTMFDDIFQPTSSPYYGGGGYDFTDTGTGQGLYSTNPGGYDFTDVGTGQGLYDSSYDFLGGFP